MQYVLVAAYLLFSTGGLILIKLGGDTLHLSLTNNILSLSTGMISLLGYCLYLVSFLLFTKVITLFDLSYIIPICTGIAQVIILLAAVFIFEEKLNFLPCIGIFLVIIGITLMNIKQVN